MKIFDRKLILASKSPRRSQLLEQAGFSFTIRTREVDETYPDSLPSQQVAVFLAEKKANECADFLENEEEVLLTADSVVILDDVIYGKPVDFADAKRILGKLSGRVHDVVTGVCLLSKTKKRVFASVSKVHFEPLSEEEIEFYLKKYEPYDKAGSYAIQEWIGLCKISKIDGTYSNIMGLPMEAVFRELEEF